MKLRFRQNSLRLRVNRRELERLSNGVPLEEQVHFPGDTQLGYVLEGASATLPAVDFRAGIIRVAIPSTAIQNWASTDEIGLYFDLPANGRVLNVAIEKDLECIDGPPQERDPDAFPRSDKNC
ncbi:MAG: hypothetical protein JO051_07175 [Acidobacteriaceae bacterium]|nr:hypothetical protein [Acidobacteriaceae bacterium]